MKKTILIAENDPQLAQLLFDQLGSKYQCKLVTTLQKAYDLLEQHEFELVIADRLLDDGDSLELIEYLHDCAFQTKVLVISKLGESRQRINGLEKGADDYLPKPFSLGELKLKVEKMMTLTKLGAQNIFQFGKVTIYPDQGLIQLDKKRKPIRKREMEILTCLARHQNQVLTRDTLIDRVWTNQEKTPTYATLDVYIRRLRMRLGKYHSLIKTVRGFGYCLRSDYL